MLFRSETSTKSATGKTSRYEDERRGRGTGWADRLGEAMAVWVSRAGRPGQAGRGCELDVCLFRLSPSVVPSALSTITTAENIAAQPVSLFSHLPVRLDLCGPIWRPRRRWPERSLSARPRPSDRQLCASLASLADASPSTPPHHHHHHRSPCCLQPGRAPPSSLPVGVHGRVPLSIFPNQPHSSSSDVAICTRLRSRLPYRRNHQIHLRPRMLQR